VGIAPERLVVLAADAPVESPSASDPEGRGSETSHAQTARTNTA